MTKVRAMTIVIHAICNLLIRLVGQGAAQNLFNKCNSIDK